jgi:predicted transcriptional regulator
MTTPLPIAEQLRAAIRESGRSLYELAKAADVPYASLHGFMTGKSLKIETAEMLGKAIGLKSFKL